MKHYLTDQNDKQITVFDSYNKELIKQAIIEHLTVNPKDTVFHEKECLDSKYVGNDLLNCYEVNPKNGKPSKVIQTAKHIFYKAL